MAKSKNNFKSVLIGVAIIGITAASLWYYSNRNKFGGGLLKKEDPNDYQGDPDDWGKFSEAVRTLARRHGASGETLTNFYKKQHRKILAWLKGMDLKATDKNVMKHKEEIWQYLLDKNAPSKRNQIKKGELKHKS